VENPSEPQMQFGLGGAIVRAADTLLKGLGNTVPVVVALEMIETLL